MEPPAFVKRVGEKFAELRAAAGPDADIAIDFHGAISPATAKLLIKELEPHEDPDRLRWLPSQGAASAMAELLAGSVDVVC